LENKIVKKRNYDINEYAYLTQELHKLIVSKVNSDATALFDKIYDNDDDRKTIER